MKIRSTRPTIKATVLEDTLRDVFDIALFINGKSIPASSYTYAPETGAFSYRPRKNMPAGKKTVKIMVTDAALNTTTATWSFTIRR